jgi:GntR family transcriptional repressor for pyruvate dehydrogenase complex
VADVVQHVVQSTVALGMAPGDRLPPERRLTEMLGVGRSPLREALKCLDILGFIEIRQGDGTYLAANASQVLPQVVSWGLLLGTREAQELIEARYYIEVTLARLAATRRGPDVAGRLTELLAEMANASTPEAFASADTAFHLEIAHAAQNPPLASVLESVKSLLDVWVVRVVEATPDRDDLVTQHRRIAEAIAAADPDAAANFMGEHIAAVTTLLQGTVS